MATPRRENGVYIYINKRNNADINKRKYWKWFELSGNNAFKKE